MYSDDTVQLENQRNLARSPPQDTQSFPPQTNDRSVDIKEISSLARRAITRDLENWNAIESYLDRAKYQNHPLYRRRILVPERGYGIEQTVRGIGSSLSDAFEGGRDFELYEEIGEQARIRSGDRVDTVRRLTPRDLAGRDSFGSIRYQDRASQDVEAIPVANGDSSPLEAIKNERIIEPYPTENIFAPRPQVIKYIFSKKPTTSVEAKAQTVSETKVTTKEPVPRSYGDNLIREEVKEQEGKDVKVTSIEVSEVPRHKTRHHHGEWPKRDYSKRHQS
ncbi:hypothetical protein WN55_10418 [Dufourea novaeangliae]|uniref:Uncharacterized protein n=2 Tax=Dufourea novaeangliae TaxID=178035 RepID=A0A154P3S7_DUFNO|nr:hypothetical protein WN55_10418 [Dufourea novaeangliae]